MFAIERLTGPGALQVNVAIEQINYPYLRRPVVVGLKDDELEKIAAFVRQPVLEFLERSVPRQRREQEKIGRHAIPVAGKLFENWKQPRPELAELHQHLTSAVFDISLSRLNDPAFGRYKFEEEEGWTFARIEGERDVRVRMPRFDREDPGFCEGVVYIGGREISIDIHTLSRISLETPIAVQEGPAVTAIDLFMMVHPLSRRVKPTEELAVPDMDLATRAVEHMKGAWMRQENNRRQGRATLAQVVIV